MLASANSSIPAAKMDLIVPHRIGQMYPSSRDDTRVGDLSSPLLSSPLALSGLRRLVSRLKPTDSQNGAAAAEASALQVSTLVCSKPAAISASAGYPLAPNGIADVEAAHPQRLGNIWQRAKPATPTRQSADQATSMASPGPSYHCVPSTHCLMSAVTLLIPAPVDSRANSTRCSGSSFVAGLMTTAASGSAMISSVGARRRSTCCRGLRYGCRARQTLARRGRMKRRRLRRP
jgi:hypothetical protein